MKRNRFSPGKLGDPRLFGVEVVKARLASEELARRSLFEAFGE